ncbi:MAG TPA: hypothetical protein VK892_01090 [Pyrinomonadaceae bacterium]|nr:hypothetical protein [Pyrinomonadaceae bacterium]
MESLEKQNQPQGGISKVFIGAFFAAVIVVIGLIALVSLIPTAEDTTSHALEGAYREGSPEFETLSKRIVVLTDANRLTQSQTALGSIQMNMGVKVLNRTDQTLTGLEVNAAVVDSQNQVIKDKTIQVIPRNQETLAPGEMVDLTTTIAGFDADDDRANVRWKVTAIKTAQQ